MKDWPKTIFCDIDGTLLKHKGVITRQHLGKGKVLNNVLEAITEWNKKGYTIVLTTGRKESVRRHTELQLAEAGIFYDHLIMGLPRGPRVLVNDFKPNSTKETAIAISLERNTGLTKDLIDI